MGPSAPGSGPEAAARPGVLAGRSAARCGRSPGGPLARLPRMPILRPRGPGLPDPPRSNPIRSPKMRIKSGVLLAALAFALPAAAQKTEGQQGKTAGEVEKLWKIEATGIAGRGAAPQPKRGRDILAHEKCRRNLSCDTTGIGYF